MTKIAVAPAVEDSAEASMTECVVIFHQNDTNILNVPY